MMTRMIHDTCKPVLPDCGAPIVIVASIRASLRFPVGRVSVLYLRRCATVERPTILRRAREHASARLCPARRLGHFHASAHDQQFSSRGNNVAKLLHSGRSAIGGAAISRARSMSARASADVPVCVPDGHGLEQRHGDTHGIAAADQAGDHHPCRLRQHAGGEIRSRAGRSITTSVPPLAFKSAFTAFGSAGSRTASTPAASAASRFLGVDVGNITPPYIARTSAETHQPDAARTHQQQWRARRRGSRVASSAGVGGSTRTPWAPPVTGRRKAARNRSGWRGCRTST